jgi:hypothetical protein
LGGPHHFFRFGGDCLGSAAKRGIAALLRRGSCWRLAAISLASPLAPPHRFAFGEGYAAGIWRGELVGGADGGRRRLADAAFSSLLLAGASGCLTELAELHSAELFVVSVFDWHPSAKETCWYK